MEEKKLSENDVIKWQLKYLNEHASELSSSDLEWAIRMEQAFKDFGSLTPRQRETLENIYKKY